MDYGKLLGRAWQITWRWKVLWLLGFLVALGSGGGTGNLNFNFPEDRSEWVRQQIPPQVTGTLIVIAIVLVALAILIGLALWLIGIIARGGLVVGVQQVEEENSTGFKRAWRAGVQRFWTLLGIHALLEVLPAVVFGLLLAGLILLFVGGGVGIGVTTESAAPVALAILAGLCCAVPFICGAAIVFIVLGLLVLYAERAAMLEGLGATTAIKRGWQVLKANLGPTLLLWLIFLAIGLGVGLVTMGIFAVIAGPVVAILLSTEPAWWWIAPVGIGLLLLFAVSMFIRSVLETFTSATWTLAYRQMTGLQPAAVRPAAAEPAQP